jgi:hypothetical protein
MAERARSIDGPQYAEPKVVVADELLPEDYTYLGS